MSNVKELFIKTVNSALDTAEIIPDAKDKALAFAEIAKALAMTGGVRNITELNKNEIKEETNKNDKKEIKENTKKKEENKESKKDTKKEIVKETKKEEVKENKKEDTKELNWDDVEEEVKTLQEFNNLYGDEAINQCIEQFSEGVYHSIEDITPENIGAFINFLNLLQEQTEE